MNKPVKVVAAIIFAAIAAQFTWFEVTNKLQTDKEIKLAREQDRPLTTAQMDGYLSKAEDAKRQDIALHRGEACVAGLRIGMTRKEAIDLLHGGVTDGTSPDVLRLPLSSQKGKEVIAKFVDDSLCFATVAPIGADAFGIDLAKRYGQSTNRSGGQ